MVNKIVEPKRILISRTDSIGDVVLTLPLCVALKKKYPELHIIFLASAYTIPVVQCISEIDEIVNYTNLISKTESEQLIQLKNLDIDCFVHVFPRKNLASLAKKAKINYRIGTSHRLFHWLSCNVKLDFSRKNSELHEAQLNFKLLEPFALNVPTWDELNSYIGSFKGQLSEVLLDNVGRPKVALHPKSQGSAVEWPIEKYVELANQLVNKGIHVYITGTQKEGQLFKDSFDWNEFLEDASGRFNLTQFISFIDQLDLLVACSTGPLHIAGALNKNCIGLYSPRKPIHPGRWMPLGSNSQVMVHAESCFCKSKEMCTCLQQIAVEKVYSEIMKSVGLGE